jgi:clan AA aspartic protease (TIGR02281 family)
MMIFSMNLEVLGKIVDALTQERDLHFRRAGIALMDPELLDDPLLLLWSNSHVSAFSLFPCLMSMFSNIVTCYCKAAITPSGFKAALLIQLYRSIAGIDQPEKPKTTAKRFFCRVVMLHFRSVKTSIAALLLQIALLVWGSRLPAADFFRWIDHNGVVHFTDNIHNIPEGRRATAIRIKGQAPHRPAEPSKLSPSTVAKASIPFEKRGQVVVVEVMLNRTVPVKLVVDTGATYTMISAATAKELSIDPQQAPRTMPFQTANGVIQAPLTNLESVTVGGMEIKNLTAAIHDAVPSAQVAGLLGLNFLSNFRLDIDTDKGILHLEKK